MNELCPYCGAATRLADSAIIYNGTSYGLVWICERYPACDAFVGCHKGTETPMGRLANRELRYWKKRAHAEFDPLWKKGPMRRGDAYYWLSQKLDIPVDKTHIGMFDIDQCKETVRVCREKREAAA